MDYFYDQQIRRLILQVTRMFSGFVVASGLDANGQTRFRQVPCKWGKPSRMAQHIVHGNSENTLLYTPFMSTYITNISMNAERRQNPNFVSTKLVDERAFDKNAGCNTEGAYTREMGDRFTVKRFMPVPYDFTFQLDIWTSNQDQQMQLMEQIMTLFNPSVQLQTSDNALDWSAITYAEMQDNITWSSRSVPAGTEEEIDVATLSFLIPNWLNPPAEVTQRKAIETIVTNINAVNELPISNSDYAWESLDQISQTIITPGNHIIDVVDDVITLLGPNGSITDENNNIYNWKELLELYSDYRSTGTNKIIIKRKFGDTEGVIGTIEHHPTDVNKLIWVIDEDTRPDNTLDDIIAIIDPTKVYPGDGLPSELSGQRYRIVDNISPDGIWGVESFANDIIEYDGSQWVVAFNSNISTTQHVITNQLTNKQYRWIPQENHWQLAVDGEYKPGTWKVHALPTSGNGC